MFDEILRALGFGLCHQLPERSLFSGGRQLPVCARDTGIYLGFVVSLALLAFLDRKRRAEELPPWPMIALGAAFVASMAWDGITSYAGLRSTTNDLRLVTGLLTGWALPLALLPMLNGQLWRRRGRGRLLESGRQAAAWLVAIPLTYVAARYLLPLTGAVYPLLVGVAILATFGAVNLVIVSLAGPFDRGAERLRDLALPVGAALLLTLVEVAGAAWLRVALLRLAGVAINAGSLLQ